ncbi:MAG: extracellular solute-binding protein [Christensenellales bacterium]
MTFLHETVQNAEPNTLPLSTTNETLTIYISLYGPEVHTTNKEHTVFQKIEEIMGINLEFVSPPAGGDSDEFLATLIASGEYPDIIEDEHSFFNTDYPGGVAGAIEDGILINMNELSEKYAPNFYAELARRGAFSYRWVIDDNGILCAMGCEMDPPILDGIQHTGLVLRQDYLDTIGKEVPVTMDELTEVLRAFRDELKIEYPFGMSPLDTYTGSNCLSCAWDVALNAYQLDADGNVVYSRTMDGYKEFLKYMNMWYEEGLIDRDFINRTENDCMKLMYNDRAGCIEIGCWNAAEMMKVGILENEAFQIVPMVLPRMNSIDETVTVAQPRQGVIAHGGAWYITTACKNPELAMKFLDWFYSPEGIELTNFGVGELPDGNVTYYIDKDTGLPVFTDFMLNNPDLAFDAMRRIYTVQGLQSQYHNEFIRQEYDTEIQQSCWATWKTNMNNSKMLPDALRLTIEESEEFIRTQNEIKTYTDEMIYKFICGELNIDENWDNYVITVNELGALDNAAIQMAAYERYLNR